MRQQKTGEVRLNQGKATATVSALLRLATRRSDRQWIGSDQISLAPRL